MEAILETKSIGSLLVAIICLLAAHFIKGMVEFVWKAKQEKDSVHDTTLKELVLSVKKTNHAINNLFTAIKIVAGEKWPEIKEVLEDRNKLEL